jgi:hypothetical protein
LLYSKILEGEWNMGEDTILINNAELYDEQEDRYLSEEEITKRKLFINPTDASIWRFYNGEMLKEDERYSYYSY